MSNQATRKANGWQPLIQDNNKYPIIPFSNQKPHFRGWARLISVQILVYLALDRDDVNSSTLMSLSMGSVSDSNDSPSQSSTGRLWSWIQTIALVSLVYDGWKKGCHGTSYNVRPFTDHRPPKRSCYLVSSVAYQTTKYPFGMSESWMFPNPFHKPRRAALTSSKWGDLPKSLS